MLRGLIGASLAVNLALLLFQGVRAGGDSHRYISGADALLQGSLQGKAWSYSGYVWLVALSKAAGLGLVGAVVTQIIMSALASGAVYSLARRQCGHFAGVMAASLVIVNPDLARWHAYVLTDSPYTSLVALSAWAISRASDCGGRWYVWASCMALFGGLVRPNGWILLPIACASWMLRAAGRNWRQELAVIGILALSGLALVRVPYFREIIERESLDVMLLRGEVIWGYPEGRLKMPRDEELGAGWSAATGYVLRHPLASARLAAARVLTELAHVRPFYSARHNIAAGVEVGVLYALAAVGLAGSRREPSAYLLLGVIAGHLLVVGMTFADWDGRFLLHVLPLIGVFSACGASRLLGRLAVPAPSLRCRA